MVFGDFDECDDEMLRIGDLALSERPVFIVFSRFTIDWRVSSSLRTALALDGLEQAPHESPIRVASAQRTEGRRARPPRTRAS